MAIPTVGFAPHPWISAPAPLHPYGTSDLLRHIRAGPTPASAGPVHPGSASSLNGRQAVNPSAFYSAEPAPVGIADYGVDGSGGGYSYNTTTFFGDLQFGTVSTRNSSLAYGREFTIQLNVVLQFTRGASTYSYWIQDVADLNTSNNVVVMIDNVWNFSSPGGALPSSSFTGNGSFVASPSYYYDVASYSLPGNGAVLPFPVDFGLRVVSSNVSGTPGVAYQYNDTGRWVTYDNLAFGWAKGGADSGFVVNGNSYNPRGLFDDAELILGGPGGGSATEDFGARIHENLFYWNGHNFQKVLNAYNHGSDTAEAIWNLTARGFHYVSNGTLFGYLTAGAGTLGRLYSRSLVSLLNVSVPFSRGELFLNGTDYGPFVGGDANVTVGPGLYVVSVDRNGSLYGTRTVAVPAASYVPVNFTNATHYPVDFHQTGLPAGGTWSVTLGGSMLSSGGRWINFSAVNGSVGYSARVPAGYLAQPWSGTVVVSGAGANVSVGISRVLYNVTFTQGSLPSGTIWSVALNGTILSGNTTSLSAQEPNGSFPYTVGFLSGYRPSPSSGTMVVAGSPRSLTILFSQVDYIVTFFAPGLPSTVHWSFAFAGLNYSTNQSLLSVLVPNGTYGFQVFPIPGYTESPSAGSVPVNGGPASQTFTFTIVTYAVYVNATGLPVGAMWALTVDGSSTIGSLHSVLLREPNGTHRIQAGAVPGYLTRSPIVVLDVQGRPASVTYPYTMFTYLVTLAATGLPQGLPWSATVRADAANISNSTSGTLLSFTLPNGSFAYSVAAPAGYTATPSSGSDAVTAASVSLLITFRPIVGSVAGSVDPAGALLTINGTPVMVSDGAFLVTLSPGTYDLRATAPGYAAWTETVTVSAGNTTNVRVDLTANPSSSPSGLSIGSTPLLLLIAVVGAAVVIAALVARRRSRDADSGPRRPPR
ncbi:MAG: thermopsin family protease [Thermoplasmata archaeon]|nr:thermopsin family protease [Thermoplasmata archaeon]